MKEYKKNENNKKRFEKFSNIQMNDQDDREVLTRIVQSINNRNSKKNTKRIYFPIFAAVVVLLLGFVMWQSEDIWLSSEKPPVLYNEIKGLDEFPYEVKLPSYLPFEAKEVWVRQEPLTKYNEEEPFAYAVVITYRGGTDLETLSIYIDDMGDANEQDGKVLNTFSNGIPYLYEFNGVMQMLLWNDEGLQYIISTPTNEFQNEQYSVEELELIAESFVDF